MRKAWGTEATVSKKKVEMKADLKAGEPLKPKELVDWKKSDKVITDAMETVKVILELSDIKDEPEDWFKQQWYDIATKSDGTKFLLAGDWMWVDTDIVRRTIQILYWGKYAYLKKGDFELYWQVDVKRFVRQLDTPLGSISIPIITVNDVPVFFNSKWCLTEWERSTYELYNNKEYDYDKMELEKKIMADLILYAQSWTKSMDESKTIFDRIQKECENMWVLKNIKFADWVFTLNFDWRMWTDTAHNQPGMVFPPFTITIDFVRKNLWLRGWHPHRWQWGFCLGWELTKIKDRCFKEKDIYWLVMGMIQFGVEWNSNDVWHWDRHPWNCIIKTYNDGFSWDINDLPVSIADILLTVIDYSYTYVIEHDWLKNPLKDLLMNNEWFRALFLERVKDSRMRSAIISNVLSPTERENDFIKALL